MKKKRGIFLRKMTEIKKKINRENSNYSFKPQLVSHPLSSNDLTFLERMEKLQKVKEEK